MSSTGYRAVLRTPGVPYAFLFSALGRLSYATIGLGLLFTTQRATGSFAAAGLALGAFGGVTVTAPFKSRLVDRLGRRRTLPVLAVVYALALLTAGLSDSRTAGLYIGAAAVAGLTAPPLGATMRAIWAALFPDPVIRQRVYGLDSATEEVLHTVGPLLVGALLLWADAGAALVLSATLAVVGTVGLVSSRACRFAERRPRLQGASALASDGSAAAVQASGLALDDSAAAVQASGLALDDSAAAVQASALDAQAPLRPAAPTPPGTSRPSAGGARKAVGAGAWWRRLAGPLHRPGFSVLVLLCFGLGLGAGPLDVAIAARADQAGQPAAAGYLLAAMALGSAAGGLLWGHRTRTARTSRAMAALLGGIAIATALAGLVTSLPLLAPVLLLLGAGSSPLFVVAWLATDTLVPDEERTEASTWLDTASNLGLTAGAAVAGVLAERSEPGLALVAGAGVLAVTAFIARLSGRAVDRN